MKSLVSILFLLLISVSAHSQLIRTGLHIGGGGSRLTLNQNKLNDQVFVRQGPVFPVGSFGIQTVLSGPKDQESRRFTLKKELLFEASLCRCGGRIELTTTLPNGGKTFNELTYVQYQGNYSVKAMVGTKNFRFMLGPNISSNFYSGVQLGGAETNRSAKSQFNPIAIGYEVGVGVWVSKVFLSSRYRSYITNYGQKSSLIPTEYGNSQLLFVLSYFYIEKHRPKNHSSIFWD